MRIRIGDQIKQMRTRRFGYRHVLDIVFVEIDTVGETIDYEQVFGSVEAVKTVSDLFLPLSGEIIEFNEDLESNPESVNSDPYGAGWMIKVKVSDVSQFDELLDSEAYAALIGA